MLLREGIITLDQLEQAIVKLSSGKRLGTLLVEAGHLSPENLVRGVLGQVRAIVLGVFAWEDGEYDFHEGPLPTDEVVTLTMRTAEVLLQEIRQIRSFSRVRRSVGPPSTRVRLEGGWRQTLDGLEIRDGERMLLQDEFCFEDEGVVFTGDQSCMQTDACQGAIDWAGATAEAKAASYELCRFKACDPSGHAFDAYDTCIWQSCRSQCWVTAPDPDDWPMGAKLDDPACTSCRDDRWLVCESPLPLSRR